MPNPFNVLQPTSLAIFKSADVTVHIDVNIYCDDVAEEVIKWVMSDCKEIGKAAKGLEKPVSIYVVEKTISGKPEATGNKVFCNYHDIKSGEYRKYLVQASFELPSYWKSIGLEWFIFEGSNQKKPIDKELLKTFFDDEKNHKVLSLIPAYFMTKFTDNSVIGIAKDTA